MAIVNNEFQRDAVAFLGKNVLAYNLEGAVQGIIQCVIERDPGTRLAALRLAEAGDTDRFAAYYLAYSDNTSHQLTLGNMANFMFTPPLTGCSFVIDTRWFNPTVSHHNRQTADRLTDQPAVDCAIWQTHGSQASRGLCTVTANYHAVRKADYVPQDASPYDHRLHVVGVRGALGWYMYRMKNHMRTETVTEAPSRIN